MLGFVGVGIALFWIHQVGGGELLDRLKRARPEVAVVLPALTSFWLFTRFIRFHFLLRCVDVRIPIRGNLQSYLAALPGTATPAYVGELVRAVFLRKKYRVPLRTTSVLLVLERLLDVAALGTIMALTAMMWRSRILGIGFLAAAIVLGLAAKPLARRLGVQPLILSRLQVSHTLLTAFALTLAAWAAAAMAMTTAGAALGIAVPIDIGMNVFSTATLLGAITLVPAGLGATGSIAILKLQALGLPTAPAVALVTLVRLTGAGLALATGIVFLVQELRILRRTRDGEGMPHFNQIALEYEEQFSSHVWDHLLDRKLNFVTMPLKDAAGARGLDLGCGLGRQCLEMERRGFSVVGVDPAVRLLRHGRQSGTNVVGGDALRLPFRTASFDFVYTIGMLHHLPSVAAQGAVSSEVRRVLKNGGFFIVHETNPRNPLFRFYMNYVFPLLKSIDEGTERWIDPPRWQAIDGMKVVEVHYFTFLPDFLPRFLMRPFLWLQRRLESSRLRPYAVHYAVILQRQ